MFNKKVEIDEIDLGAILYLRGLKESKQDISTQNIFIETPQEPKASIKNCSSEDVLEMAKDLLAI